MTLAELSKQLERQIADAEAMHATAPVATVLGTVLTSLQTLDGIPTTTPPPERLMSLEEAGQVLGVTPRWLRENRPACVVELSPKKLKVSERKLTAWLRRS